MIVPHSEEARRRKLLNGLLLWTMGIVCVLALAMGVSALTGLWPDRGREFTRFYEMLGYALLAMLVSFLLNRRGHTKAGSIVLVGALLTILAFVDDLPQVVEGRSLFAFAFPIILAGILLRPQDAFIVAGAVDLFIAVAAVGVLHRVPSIPALFGFLLIACASWASARSLAQAMDGLRRQIAEREQAEEALRRSEERYRAVSELVSDYAYSFRVEPDGRLVPEWFTDAFTRVTGYTWEDVQAWPDMSTYVHPDDLPISKARTRDLLAGGQDVSEFRIVTKSGGVRWIRSYAHAVSAEPGGRVVRIFGAGQDITERKQAEEEREHLQAQVLHAQKLESLGVLAGGIAHDFNNLLTAILGNADLALMDLPADSPVRQSLAEIGKAARRASELSNQMLAYSGRGRFIVGPINLSDLVREMGELLGVSISKKAIVEYDLAPNLSATIADAAQLRQVVINLITNASEALGEQEGTITLRTRAVQVEQKQLAEAYLSEGASGGRYVSLEVSDTGCGMDEATKARIFDPFFTTKFAGRGLGLAAVLGIVRGHQGAIKVDSTPGVGTTFTVLFPCTEQPVEPVAQTESPEALPQGAGSTIPVVDDEESAR